MFPPIDIPLSFFWFANLNSGVLAALVGGDLAPLADFPLTGERAPLGDFAEFEFDDLVEFGDVTPEPCLFWLNWGGKTRKNNGAHFTNLAFGLIWFSGWTILESDKTVVESNLWDTSMKQNL